MKLHKDLSMIIYPISISSNLNLPAQFSSPERFDQLAWMTHPIRRHPMCEHLNAGNLSRSSTPSNPTFRRHLCLRYRDVTNQRRHVDLGQIDGHGWLAYDRANATSSPSLNSPLCPGREECRDVLGHGHTGGSYIVVVRRVRFVDVVKSSRVNRDQRGDCRSKWQCRQERSGSSVREVRDAGVVELVEAWAVERVDGGLQR